MLNNPSYINSVLHNEKATGTHVENVFPHNLVAAFRRCH
jgi:hypothetical protein